MSAPSNNSVIIISNESTSPLFYIFNIFAGSIGIILILWTCIKRMIIIYQNLLVERTNEREYNSYESENAENNVDLEVAERNDTIERTEHEINFGINNMKRKKTKKLTKKKYVTNCDNKDDQCDEHDDNDENLPSYSQVISI